MEYSTIRVVGWVVGGAVKLKRYQKDWGPRNDGEVLPKGVRRGSVGAGGWPDASVHVEFSMDRVSITFRSALCEPQLYVPGR